MSEDNPVNRRRFLAAAGAGAIGGLTRPASAQSTLTIRRQAEIPYKPDVLVVGGGPAGIGAALGAASSGANTLLIEHHAFFGGVAAWCLGMPINQMRPGRKPRSKLHELVLSKLRAYGDQAVRVGDHQLWCNVDYLKVAVLDALDEVGCKYLVHTRAIDAVVEGDRITGVVVATKRGPAVVRAKAIVDCTGDADVAYYAGAETMKEAGSLSPMTLCLNLTNVTQKQIHKANIRDIARKAKKKYSLIPDEWGLGKVSNSNSFYINHAIVFLLSISNPIYLSMIVSRNKCYCGLNETATYYRSGWSL